VKYERQRLFNLAEAGERLPAVSYQVWLTPEQIELISAAQKASGLNWPEWSVEAVARLCREEDSEIQSLLKLWKANRHGKKLLSFRLYPHTLYKAQEIAKKHGRTVQALFGHAHFMQAFALRATPSIASRQ
jgi:hypothetical protein